MVEGPTLPIIWRKLWVAVMYWLMLPGGLALGQQSSGLQKLFENVQQGVGAANFLGSEAESSTENNRARPAPRWEASSEHLPEPRLEGRLPLAGSHAGDGIQMSENARGEITLIVRDAPLSRVLALLAETQDLNIVTSDAIDRTITITLRDVPLEEALTAILAVANYTWVDQNGIILITSLADGGHLPASVQGRRIQIFDLDYARATAVADGVTDLLSPIGKVSTMQSDQSDNRRTREMVIVEDLPEPLARIASYIQYVDQPPRQVQIEAHILQVTLDDTNRHGVNLDALARLADARLHVTTRGLAPDGSQGFMATLDSTDLDSVIEILQTSRDIKSLGSPRLLVLNEQEARIHVGESIGYQTTLTTELSVNQAPDSLEVGVVLRITPRITRDNRVLLHVEPEVSTGQINPITQAPDKQTTELRTDVMLRDGQGMIIGGLIKETDSIQQQKVPYLGDIKGVGWFFRRSEVHKERVEVIIALVPRVQPYDCEWQAYEEGRLVKANVPLFDGPLKRTHRPWDPVLPDGHRVTKPLIPRRQHLQQCAMYPHGMHYYVPRRPLPEPGFAGACCEPPPSPAVETMPFLSEDGLPGMERGESWHHYEVISDQE